MAYDLSNWLPHDPQRPDHPISEHTCVKVTYHVKDNATGEVRHYPTWATYDEEDGDAPSDFMYSDGNYACDCNRHLFFGRAAGVEPEDDAPCGDDRYSMNVSNTKTGEVFYREFD